MQYKMALALEPFEHNALESLKTAHVQQDRILGCQILRNLRDNMHALKRQFLVRNDSEQERKPTYLCTWRPLCQSMTLIFTLFFYSICFILRKRSLGQLSFGAKQQITPRGKRSTKRSWRYSQLTKLLVHHRLTLIEFESKITWRCCSNFLTTMD